MDIQVKNGHRRIMRERKLMSCNNGRYRSTGIMRGREIRSKRYGNKGSI